MEGREDPMKWLVVDEVVRARCWVVLRTIRLNVWMDRERMVNGGVEVVVRS